MKYLGIDYGTKRVGIAVSDADGTIAFPRAAFPNDAKLVDEIAALVEREGVEALVIGDTKTHGGAENPVTKEARAFAEKLEKRIGVPVTPAFELWSSIEASRYAPEGKGHDDASAAAIILQRYLEMHTGRVE